MAYIETMKMKVMRMPCSGRDERKAFEWMLSRYTESGSDEDLADIERIAEYNRHAAYWLHHRAVESGEGDDMGYLEKEGSQLAFRFLPGGDSRRWKFSRELTDSVAALGGQIVWKDLDDAFGICLSIPLGGESCG